MQTLLLKFSAPMQSWGTKSHYETRQTDAFPSKSAVIGMLAAALGYRRDENEKLAELNELSFAVRKDQPGNLLRDFQIATSYKPNGDKLRSYVTNRYYLQDAVFVVALGSENNTLLNKVLTALKQPYFQLFLGRRSLPINWDYLTLMTKDGVIEPLPTDVVTALEQTSWQAHQNYQNYNSDVTRLEFCADEDLLETDAVQMVSDYVESFAQGRTRSECNSSDRREYRLRPVGFGYVAINNKMGG
ncbi:type I-E CRISPR-associated protein Cas5/CasD [Holzapfeliella sp. JNUCC 72]